MRPDSTEYASFYAGYVKLVPETDAIDALERQLTDVLGLLRQVPESEGNVRHPPYTWSVKEVVGHITDGERVFSYRAMRFARNDPTPLPTFDENAYVRAAGFDACKLQDLTDQFEHVRRASLSLFRSMDKEAWLRRGVASGAEVTVRALAYVIVGHTRHHLLILRKRLGAARPIDKSSSGKC